MFKLSFFKDKRVLVTGHTGFKGSWLCRILLKAGAELTGFSLLPHTIPNLYNLSMLDGNLNSIIGDVRDFESLKRAFDRAKPEFVFHLAAQPIVRDGYEYPVYTYETNVMGTVNVLECVRQVDYVRSVINVTTDKVYENKEWVWGYREDEPLDGYDPYSNSKSCSELVTHSYVNSFFKHTSTAVSTARAGNVIGGGDFAVDRIIPDCIRAVLDTREIIVRNPYSTRPYQHVLDPLFAYLLIAKMQYSDMKYAGWYNIGPDGSGCITTKDLVTLFCTFWGNTATWVAKEDSRAPHEAFSLKLDCSKLATTFNWYPRWNIRTAIENTVEWTKAWINDPKGVPAVMDMQIEAFLKEPESKLQLS